MTAVGAHYLADVVEEVRLKGIGQEPVVDLCSEAAPPESLLGVKQFQLLAGAAKQHLRDAVVASI